jgi:hypothetical protein
MLERWVKVYAMYKEKKSCNARTLLDELLAGIVDLLNPIKRDFK